MSLDRKAGGDGRGFDPYLDPICRSIVSPEVEYRGLGDVPTELETYGPSSLRNRFCAESGLCVGCVCETQAETNQRTNSEKSA